MRLNVLRINFVSNSIVCNKIVIVKCKKRETLKFCIINLNRYDIKAGFTLFKKTSSFLKIVILSLKIISFNLPKHLIIDKSSVYMFECVYSSFLNFQKFHKVTEIEIFCTCSTYIDIPAPHTQNLCIRIGIL